MSNPYSFFLHEWLCFININYHEMIFKDLVMIPLFYAQTKRNSKSME